MASGLPAYRYGGAVIACRRLESWAGSAYIRCMRKSVTFLTIGAFGLGVFAEALVNADVPYVFHEDGFVVMTSTGSVVPANAIVVQNMINGEEISAPPPGPVYWIVGGFNDPSSGSVT